MGSIAPYLCLTCPIVSLGFIHCGEVRPGPCPRVTSTRRRRRHAVIQRLSIPHIFRQGVRCLCTKVLVGTP